MVLVLYLKARLLEDSTAGLADRNPCVRIARTEDSQLEGLQLILNLLVARPRREPGGHDALDLNIEDLPGGRSFINPIFFLTL